MTSLTGFLLRNGQRFGRAGPAFARRAQPLSLAIHTCPRQMRASPAFKLSSNRSVWLWKRCCAHSRSFSTKPEKNVGSGVDQKWKDAESLNAPSLIAELLFKDESGTDTVSEHNEVGDHEDMSRYSYANDALVNEPDYSSDDEIGSEVSGDESESDHSDDEDDFNDFMDIQSARGTPDPTVPMSEVPCSGCGAYLHCHNPDFPGYMHSEKFTAIPPRKLIQYTCNRCMVIKIHKVALNVSVSPEQYAEVISQVKGKRALLVLLVDILDLENSILPDLSELVGRNRPVYVVGNKVDLLPKDDNKYLERAKFAIWNACIEAGVMERDIKHVALVSAKSMYGIEELVTKLMSEWGRNGHVYILGCTNVGKSSLFNALLSSDYSKSTARDLINRATICNWPGTTLNLLRFPIVNPDAEIKQARRDRLIKSMQGKYEAEMERRQQFSNTRQLHFAFLKGDVQLTKLTRPETLPAGLGDADIASYTFNRKRDAVDETGLSLDRLPEVLLDEKQYADSRWCYDTPGLVNPEQIINKLTQEELDLVLSKRLIMPRSFVVKPGQVMFVSGLARVDYIRGPTSLYLTVVTSSKLPVEVVDGEDAEEFYKESITNQTLRLPVNDPDRLSKLPSLEGRQIDVHGVGWKESSIDILLSSLGWVAVTLGHGRSAQLCAYTPGGVGCKVRSPPLLPYAINLRGKRVRGTARYHHGRVIP